MDWTLIWTAVAALGTSAATMVAAIALIMAFKQNKSAREQFLQARFDDARPILIVTEEYPPFVTEEYPPFIYRQKGSYPLDWPAAKQTVKIRNVGKGVALHLRGVLYGPEVVAIPIEAGKEQLETGYKESHWWYWLADMVRTDEKEDRELEFDRDDTSFKKVIRDKEGKEYSLNADAQSVSHLGQGPARHICRVTLTYEDIYHRKHASIFDLVHNSGWQEHAILDAIPQDLEDLRKKS